MIEQTLIIVGKIFTICALSVGALIVILSTIKDIKNKKKETQKN